jgi:hypothetical protein
MVAGEKVELVPSVVCIGEIPKGPVDRFERDSSRESKELIRLKEGKEQSYERTSTRGSGRSASVWYQSLNLVCIF